jgi:hypothetical protein
MKMATVGVELEYAFDDGFKVSRVREFETHKLCVRVLSYSRTHKLCVRVLS